MRFHAPEREIATEEKKPGRSLCRGGELTAEERRENRESLSALLGAVCGFGL
jgi:hypothetical protein